MQRTKTSILKVFSVVGFFTIMGTIYGDIDVSKFKSPKEYKGTVRSLCSTTIKMGIDQTFKGEVIYVATPGTFFKGPVINRKGNVLIPGTKLVEIDGDTLKANLNVAQANLDTKLSLYNRNKQILDKGGRGIISDQALLQAKNDYLAAKAELLVAEKLLVTTVYRARFDGMVTKMLFPGGYTTASDRDILEVKQLVPICVEIDMTRDEAAKYGAQTPIAIYPVNSSKAVGPYRGLTMVAEKGGVLFMVPNYRRIDKTVKVDGQELQVVSKITPIIPFELNQKNADNQFFLGVDLNSVQKDDEGEFVIIVDGQKMTNPINPVFKLKKVYITTIDEINPVEPNVKYIKLKTNSELQLSDIVLSAEESKNLKDGDTVYYQNTSYLFMPGDVVKVVLDVSVKDDK